MGCVLSRNKFLSRKKISLAEKQGYMKKLNKKKIEWIIREVSKGELSTYSIAKTQKITPRWAREVNKKFKDKEIIFLKPGRKKKETKREEELILETYKEFPVGAVNMEKILDSKGKHIPHNKVHEIMKKNNLAVTEPRKSRKRKWIRYERRHSNSLWHADWFEHENKHIILIEDDASRLLTGFGIFNNANAINSVITLEKAIYRFSKPKQIITDHGSHFTSLAREACNNPGPNEFQVRLIKHGIQHIKARVKHPQTNGKVERLSQTIMRYFRHFKSWDKAIEFYNYKRPHMSLENGHLRTPYQAFLDKGRK